MTSNDELEQLQEMDKFESWFLTFRKDWPKEDIHRVKMHKGYGYGGGYMQALWSGWLARSKQEQGNGETDLSHQR